jgi:hypothetical protein
LTVTIIGGAGTWKVGFARRTALGVFSSGLGASETQDGYEAAKEGEGKLTEHLKSLVLCNRGGRREPK